MIVKVWGTCNKVHLVFLFDLLEINKQTNKKRIYHQDTITFTDPPVDCGSGSGDFLIQNAALKRVVLEKNKRLCLKKKKIIKSIEFLFHIRVLLFKDTLNISKSVSFFISSLSNGCFSLMIFLHKLSRQGKSLLDTPLSKTSRNHTKNCTLNTFSLKTPH